MALKKHWLRVIWLTLAVVAVLVAYLAVRARYDLVTLSVRDADVRSVVRRIVWQTWEPILLHRGVQGKVTLEVYKAPLEEVLAQICEQTRARWVKVHPLFSAGRSLGKFKGAVCGDLDPEQNGWKRVPTMVFMAPGRPGMERAHTDGPVTLQVTNTELRLVALAISRFGNVHVVPEDGCPLEVSFAVDQAPLSAAVGQLAKQIGRKTKSYYSVQPQLGPGFGPPPPPPPGVPAGPPPPPPQPPGKEVEEAMEKDYQALREILPKQQQLKLEMERQFHQAMRESGGMPPPPGGGPGGGPGPGPGPGGNFGGGPGGGAFSAPAGGAEGAASERINKLATTTPEERVARDRQNAQRRKTQ